MSRVYYCNSGSEANEKAFKMVRQIAHKRYGGKSIRSCIVTVIITAPPLQRFPPVAKMSATPNTDPLRLASCGFPIVWNTAPSGI